MDLRQVLGRRGVSFDTAGVLARKHKSTISRIAAGKIRAQPETVVALARGLGMSASRLQAACDASWRAAHSAEETSCPAA